MNAEALLADLGAALDDPDGRRDPAGMLAAWGAVVRGEFGPDTRFRLVAQPDPATIPQPKRRRAILEAAKAGPVTSGALARELGWTSETIRGDLLALVGQGLLRRSGDKRGTVYTLASSVGASMQPDATQKRKG